MSARTLRASVESCYGAAVAVLFRRARALAAASLLAPTGCVTLAHEVGWLDFWETRSTERVEQKEIVISAEPAGRVRVARVEGAKKLELGSAPLIDVVAVPALEHTEHPTAGGLWIGSAVELGAGIAMMMSGVAARTTDAEGRSELDTGRFVGFAVSGSLVVMSGMIDAIAAFVHGAQPPRTRTELVRRSIEYEARLDGAPPVARTIEVPGELRAHFAFEAAAPRRDWVVAVMKVEDPAGGDDRLLASLGDQIRVLVAARGVKTIDRGAFELAARAQITELKRESFESCFDAACQIELGKALAASHIVRLRLGRFGARCVLNGELVALESEVSVAAASAQGGCEPEALLELGERLAGALVN